MKPLDCANLCVKLYSGETGWNNLWNTDDVVCAHTVVDGQDVLVLRGSVTAVDWVRDATTIPAWHPKLGFVHAGFLKGMDDVYATVKPVVSSRIVVVGHSLGGARARILAAMFAADGIHVETLCVFGSPKPAFINLARIIQKSGMEHFSFRNRNDVVPTMPFSLPPFLDFAHTEEWRALDAAPDANDLEPLRDHHIALYVQGLA